MIQLNVLSDRQKSITVESKQPLNYITPIKYKSLGRLTAICTILSISTFNFGYALSQISAIPFRLITAQYGIILNNTLTLSMLNGIIGIGGMIGSLSMLYMNKFFKRKNCHYFISIFAMISSGICLIPSIIALLIGRLLFGVCCGFYSSISATFIRQISPKQLRPQFGSFYSLGRIGGVLFCFSLGFLIEEVFASSRHLFIFGGPIIFAFLHLVLVYLFIPQSPAEMVAKNRLQQAMVSLRVIYKQQYVQEKLKEYIQQFKEKQLFKIQAVNDIISQIKSGEKNRDRAFILALQVALLRQFCGVNFLVIYAGQVLKDLKSPVGLQTPLIINGIQFIFGILGIFATGRFGRYPLLVFATVTLALCNFAIGVSDYFQNATSTLLFMVVYMSICGSTLAPIAWPYPSEIIPPQKARFTTFISWLGTTIVSIVPPFILNSMPDNDAYPIFMFFGAYCVFSSVYIIFFGIQTRGLNYREITSRFN